MSHPRKVYPLQSQEAELENLDKARSISNIQSDYQEPQERSLHAGSSRKCILLEIGLFEEIRTLDSCGQILRPSTLLLALFTTTTPGDDREEYVET